jgi:prepilin-type processing-associated H-X9-DG protein
MVIGIIAILLGCLLPAILEAREAARRTQCLNNLRQLGLATLNYEASHRILPPGTIDTHSPIESVASESAYHASWIVQLLPYLEQGEIARSRDKSMSIYAPANHTVRQAHISTLLCPSTTAAYNPLYQSLRRMPPQPPPGFGLSTYAGCHHDSEAPIATNQNGVFFLNSAVRLLDVTDGLSYTIFFGEVTSPDPLGWASGTRATLRNTGHPINADLDTDNAANPEHAAAPSQSPEAPGATTRPATYVGGFGSRHRGGGANFALGDGSVRFFKSSLDPSVYRRLGHRADGELIDDDSF